MTSWKVMLSVSMRSWRALGASLSRNMSLGAPLKTGKDTFVAVEKELGALGGKWFPKDVGSIRCCR